MTVLNDLAYTDPNPDPLDAIHGVIVFSVDDWGASRAMSWVYGIVVGWDDGEDGPIGDEPRNAAMDELAARHRWSPEAVARLRALHWAYVAIREAS